MGSDGSVQIRIQESRKPSARSTNPDDASTAGSNATEERSESRKSSVPRPFSPPGPGWSTGRIGPTGRSVSEYRRSDGSVCGAGTYPRPRVRGRSTAFARPQVLRAHQNGVAVLGMARAKHPVWPLCTITIQVRYIKKRCETREESADQCRRLRPVSAPPYPPALDGRPKLKDGASASDRSGEGFSDHSGAATRPLAVGERPYKSRRQSSAMPACAPSMSGRAMSRSVASPSMS